MQAYFSLQYKAYCWKLLCRTIEAFQTNTINNFQYKLEDLKGHRHADYQPTQQNNTSLQAQKNQQILFKHINPLSKMPVHIKKSKIIHKQQKTKQKHLEESTKQKQTILFKYFKRRLFHSQVNKFYIPYQNMIQKKFEIGTQIDKCFDLLKIIDWQMEASHNLQLSKDTFYTAVALSKKFFFKQANQMFSPKILQIHVASILSLAAKLQSNKINYPQAISIVCGFNKADIIEGEIFVIKSINFKIPLINVQSTILQTCLKWHQYIVQNSTSIKLQTKKLQFGTTHQILNWSYVGRMNFKNVCSIFDLIAVRQYNKFELQNINAKHSIILKALFMLVNYEAHQFFPVKATQKTYVTLVFENFMKKCFGIQNKQFTEWISQLIKQQQKLRLVQFTSKKLNIKQYYQTKQSIISLENTRADSNIYLTQFDYFKQPYTSVFHY